MAPSLLSPFEVEGKGSETGQNKGERIAVEDHGGGCQAPVRRATLFNFYRGGGGGMIGVACLHHVRGEGAEAAADTNKRSCHGLAVGDLRPVAREAEEV